MKHIVLLIVTLLSIKYGFCQNKPVLDADACRKWESINYTDKPLISNDGKYVMYIISDRAFNVASSTDKMKKEIFIQSIDQKWKLRFPAGKPFSCTFTEDSKRFIYINDHDSLILVELGTNKRVCEADVSSSQLVNCALGERLLYRHKGSPKQLIVLDTHSGSEKVLDSISRYWALPDVKKLILEKEKQPGEDFSLAITDLKNDKLIHIWSGSKPENLVFDRSCKNMAFISSEDRSNNANKVLWIYSADKNRIIEVPNKFLKTTDGILEFNTDDRWSFNESGTKLYFSAFKPEVQPFQKDTVKLNLWSYTDFKLQSQKSNFFVPKLKYNFILDLNNFSVDRPTQSGESILMASENALIIEKREAEIGGGESNWNIGNNRTRYVYSLKSGKRSLFRNNDDVLFLSPNGKYILYFDTHLKTYFSFNTTTEKYAAISTGVNTKWGDSNGKGHGDGNFPTAPVFWVENDNALLVSDINDVWRLDPEGIKTPICLTNMYGKKHDIIFRILGQPEDGRIKDLSTLNFIAFDSRTKENGFYYKRLGQGGDPIKLSMGPYAYCIPDLSRWSFIPVKARDANIFLIRRMSVAESPNFFFTKDFKSFTQLSDVHPEKYYNWMTSELHTWKSLNGDSIRGILYKPENFDPKKKYPVIFEYYELLSDKLNVYLPAQFSDGTLNISWYVSNGYLVFNPDIHYSPEGPGISSYNSVVSAANYLSKMPYIDSLKMGLQGCSHGGFHTNYIVTHSTKFAAACSTVGISNLISASGGLSGVYSGDSSRGYFEQGQGRMVESLWENPEKYIQNSPIFQVHKVTTPILLLYGKNGDELNYLQGIEFFTALRRLGKKSWFLNYQDGSHGIWGRSAQDFTTRMFQFYNHYLKNEPAPKWMLNDIPIELKGLKQGLTLDSTGKSPGKGLLNNREQLVVDSLLNMK